MMRAAIVLCLLALAGQEPRVTLEIDAVAVDRKGQPVVDLRAEDLEVWISGYQVPVDSITLVTPSTQDRGGRLIVLLLDNLTIEPAMTLRVREAARRFVTRMGPGDRMGVAALGGGALEISSDPARLLRRIDSSSQMGGVAMVDRLGAQVLTTLAAIARDVGEAPERRKTIVAIGSGGIFDRPIPPPNLGPEVRREWFDAVRAMAVANVTFYVIDPGGVNARASDSRTGFAREAGGHAFLGTNDLAGAVDQILREAGTYYVVRVGDPPVGRNAVLRELDVRSSRRGVTVRARRGILGHAQIR